MKHLSFKLKPWMLILITLVIFMVLAGAGSLANALYWHPQDRPWVRTLVNTLPVPAARIRGAVVPYKDYLVQQDAARKFLTSEAATLPTTDGTTLPKTLDTQANQAILDQLIRAVAVAQLAQEASIQLTDQDVNRSFDDLVARAGTSTSPGEIDAYLQDTFGWTSTDFKNRVVRPATLETAVRQDAYADDDAKFQSALNEKVQQAKVYIRL